MKIGLLLPGNLYFCPFVKIYTKILDTYNINYEILFWDREGIGETGDIVFKEKIRPTLNRITKFIPYIKYSLFLRKQIKQRKYDKLIVFGPQVGIFLYLFLKKKYKKRFIFDYRDLSIEQIFKKTFAKLLNISCVNVISSSGFKKYLPKQFDYILSHNFDVDIVKEMLKQKDEIADLPNNSTIDVLTIGGIRDYESNLSVIKALENKLDFTLRFVGKGASSQLLEKYTKEHNVENVYFHGFYKKEEESDFIKHSSFMNIFYPKIKSHETALSNRFYNALIYKKPMIVTSNSVQGEYIEKYGLGLSMDNCNNLDIKIKEYIAQFDFSSFCKRCNLLLELFIKDYSVFEKSLLTFMQCEK
jgi:hypothetical protein